MVAMPLAMPDTTAPLTVAMPGDPELQVPLPIAIGTVSISVMVLPTHRLCGPDMVPASASGITVMVL